MDRTIQDMLDEQKAPHFRLLSIADLDCWAMVNCWLLVEVEVYDDDNIVRHYLTPIGNELLFYLNQLEVTYGGTRRGR